MKFNSPHFGDHTKSTKQVFSKCDKKNDDHILALGLYTASESLATADIRKDSLQNIVRILAHAKFPANKKELMDCALKRNAENEVIETIKHLPLQTYHDLSFLISIVMENKINSTKYP